MTPAKVVLIVGSLRKPQSTSAALGQYLLDGLCAQGWEQQVYNAHASLRTPENLANTLAAVDAADLVVLAFPLYVDGLPARLMRLLEEIAAYRAAAGPREAHPQRLVAIANCGFPEAHHNETALAVCELFAAQSGFQWAGGLALGAGGAVNGQSLDKLGGMARNIRLALDEAAAALAGGQNISPATVERLARPLIPNWLYIQIGHFGWWQSARQNGVWQRMRAQPYRN